MTSARLPLSTLVEACAEAAPLLGLPDPARTELLELIDRLREDRVEPRVVAAGLRRMRYLLMECSDEPIASILVDRIGRHLDDGVGGLFF